MIEVMVEVQDWTTFEKVSLLLSFLLLAAGFAELAELINLLPMYVYLFILWVLAILTWIHRRRLQ